MKLLFTGDINFRENEHLTIEEAKDILSEVQPYLDSVDFCIPNLETPLADKNKHRPIKKSGPNLICPPENIMFLQALGASAVTLANNHIGDFGESAVIDTINLLDKNNILHAGAGKNIESAYKKLVISKKMMCPFQLYLYVKMNLEWQLKIHTAQPAIIRECF